MAWRMPFPRMSNYEPSRRQFVAFLAGSPLLAAAGLDASTLERLVGATKHDRSGALDIAHQLAQTPVQQPLIQSAKDGLSVFDFEPVAKQKIPLAHWGYLATGTYFDLLGLKREWLGLKARSVSNSANQARPSVPMVSLLILSSGLKRCSS